MASVSSEITGRLWKAGLANPHGVGRGRREDERTTGAREETIGEEVLSSADPEEAMP